MPPRAIRTLLCLSLLSCSTLFADNHTSSFAWEDATIAEVHQAMKKGNLSCVELVQDYIARIQKYDLDLSRGAPINAIVNINPDVLNEARILDQEYAQTHQFVGPLHCIPAIIKDNIDMVEAPSTSGSLSLLGSQPTQDAFLVSQLRKAGAIILAHGGMDEFASGMSGISSRSGRIGNAYDPTQNPGGSSGGVAAAVSANFAMVGIGTDNSGSVRIPAAFNGLYGLRPTQGLISQRGIFPRGNIDGTAGPITRTVADLATVLSVIAVTDNQDTNTLQAPRTGSYIPFLNKDALKGKRIGVVMSADGINAFPPPSSYSAQAYQNALETLQNSGVQLVYITLPQFNTNRNNNMAGEVEQINNYLSTFPSTRQNFMDICKSNRSIIFDSVKDCIQHAKQTGKVGGNRYQQALATIDKNRQYVQQVMTNNNLDALIMPLTQTGVADYDTDLVNTGKIALASNAGLPAITLLIGYKNNIMPVSMELIGKSYDEGNLISMAYAFEQIKGPRLAPNMGDVTNLSMAGWSIPMMNNFFTIIGNTTFEQVLKNSTTDMINPDEFSKIVEQEYDIYSK